MHYRVGRSGLRAAYQSTRACTFDSAEPADQCSRNDSFATLCQMPATGRNELFTTQVSRQVAGHPPDDRRQHHQPDDLHRPCGACSRVVQAAQPPLRITPQRQHPKHTPADGPANGLNAEVPGQPPERSQPTEHNASGRVQPVGGVDQSGFPVWVVRSSFERSNPFACNRPSKA